MWSINRTNMEAGPSVPVSGGTGAGAAPFPVRTVNIDEFYWETTAKSAHAHKHTNTRTRTRTGASVRVVSQRDVEFINP